MIKVNKVITIKGVEAEMLFTPRLFAVAADLKIKLSLDSANVMLTLAAYADMCYCAALNAWTMDHDIEDFRLKRADFHEWATTNQEEFAKTMKMAAEAITGKTMSELANEQKQAADSNDVKKKNSSNSIIAKLRRFWSAIVG